MKIHKTDDTVKNRLADSDFTDEELKEAARIILDSMVEYVDNLPYSKNPPPEMPLPVLSSASKQKRISKNRKKFLIQITAAATIIFVSAGSFFAFNDDVAAAAKRIFKIKIIRELDNHNSSNNINHSPAWIPDGYQLRENKDSISLDATTDDSNSNASQINIGDFIKIERIDTNKGMKSYSYENDSGDRLDISMFFTELTKKQTDSNISSYLPDSCIEKYVLPEINTMAAAYYSSKGGDLNYIILRDEENGLTFIISGNASIDELKKIAEHIKE